MELVRGEEEAAEGLGGQLIGLGGEVLVLPQVAVDGGVNPAVDHVADELPHVLSVQHLAALLIDDFTLDVHHVVVFQGVLSGLEVLGLHLFLGVLNGAGENLGVNGGVVVNLQGLHHVLHPLGAEQTHDVVLHGQVEAALTGISLPAGPAPELVVDAAGLMTFGAQNEQAAGLPHFFRLGGQFFFMLGLGLGEHLPGLENLLVVGLGKAGGLGDHLVGQARLAQVVLGQKLRIAPQHDVGTTAGHVGGHGDRPELAGLGDNLGLLLMVFGVEDVVLDALLGQQL